jgi:hypothetical protein
MYIPDEIIVDIVKSIPGKNRCRVAFGFVSDMESRIANIARFEPRKMRRS